MAHRLYRVVVLSGYRISGSANMQGTGAVFGVASGATAPGPALEGGPALQAYEFVKLYSPVNWKC